MHFPRSKGWAAQRKFGHPWEVWNLERVGLGRLRDYSRVWFGFVGQPVGFVMSPEGGAAPPLGPAVDEIAPVYRRIGWLARSRAAKGFG